MNNVRHKERQTEVQFSLHSKHFKQTNPQTAAKSRSKCRQSSSDLQTRQTGLSRNQETEARIKKTERQQHWVEGLARTGNERCVLLHIVCMYVRGVHLKLLAWCVIPSPPRHGDQVGQGAWNGSSEEVADQECLRLGPSTFPQGHTPPCPPDIPAYLLFCIISGWLSQWRQAGYCYPEAQWV